MRFSLGVGLRPVHYPHLRQKPPLQVSWFEAISENFMDSGGKPLETLQWIRSQYPVALHGVSLSIGATGNLNDHYLSRLKSLVDRIDPWIVSDHLCWTGAHSANIHDLLPVPFTEESLRHLSARVDRVQSYLRRPIALENVSSYLTYRESEMTEWEFLAKLAETSGCKLLLDINNVYVSASNHGFSAQDYLDHIPAKSVGQIHLAGFTDMGDFLFDTHSKPVHEDVWALYRNYARKFSEVPVLLEWDDDIPAYVELEKEALKAQAIWQEVNA